MKPRTSPVVKGNPLTLKSNTENELKPLDADSEFANTWINRLNNTDFARSINLTLDKFKASHSSKELPHVFSYNQAALAGVREFLDLYFLIPKEILEETNP